MNIQLLQGVFNSKDALELITQMIDLKIRYHEKKIVLDSREEDIKYRESKIKTLHKELFELRNFIDEKNDLIRLDAIIKVEK